MSYRHSSIYPTSNTSSLSSAQPATSALQTRINAKRAELDNLKQLRDLSAALAAQMAALESKLATLRDGTEAVAAVMGNWEGVLGAIGMAGKKVQKLAEDKMQDDGEEKHDDELEPELPETLVRIPVQDTKAAGG